MYLVEVPMHNYCHADSNYYATIHGFGKKKLFKKNPLRSIAWGKRVNAVTVRYTLYYNICIIYHNFINCMFLACLKNTYTITYMRVIRDVYAPIYTRVYCIFVCYYNIPSGKNEIRLTE